MVDTNRDWYEWIDSPDCNLSPDEARGLRSLLPAFGFRDTRWTLRCVDDAGGEFAVMRQKGPLPRSLTLPVVGDCSLRVRVFVLRDSDPVTPKALYAERKTPA